MVFAHVGANISTRLAIHLRLAVERGNLRVAGKCDNICGRFPKNKLPARGRNGSPHYELV